MFDDIVIFLQTNPGAVLVNNTVMIPSDRVGFDRYELPESAAFQYYLVIMLLCSI